MTTKLIMLGIRGTEEDRRRLAAAAEALNQESARMNRPGRVSASDVGIFAVRKYLQELVDQGLMPAELPEDCKTQNILED